MNAGPYSNENVQRFIEKEFIPLKSECSWTRPTELMKKFRVKWTPTLLVHDPEGIEHHRFVGYVPIDDFLGQLGLGKGKVFFDADQYAKAIAWFKSVIEQNPRSGAAPEAIFLLGVAEYKQSHDAKALRRAYDMLSTKYSESEWSRRAEPYSAIQL